MGVEWKDCDRVVTMISELGHEALPSEIAKFLIATNGFVSFMRNRHGEAKAHSRNSETLVGPFAIRSLTVESMIRDGLLKSVGSENVNSEGILEYLELTETARAWAMAYR
jgi:hypothetical protein